MHDLATAGQTSRPAALGCHEAWGTTHPHGGGGGEPDLWIVNLTGSPVGNEANVTFATGQGIRSHNEVMPLAEAPRRMNG